MKAYSLDLRQKVLAAALRGNRTIREVAELFGIGTSFVNKVLDLHRTGQDIAPARTAAATRHACYRATRSCCARESGNTRTPRSKN
jgi:transposase